jgi:non-specific serine/threonine protein kinase
MSSSFPDGVCMVQLSGLRDADLLPATVAGALGLRSQSADGHQLDVLVDHLRGKRILIILDTCEHLIDGCAMLADVVLRGADSPRLVATSRQALDIPGEVVYPIPPLAVPDDGGDAVALFADRVSAAVPGFTISEETLPRVVALCRGLDGIPLAIELAAVRLRAVGLDELLARLSDRLRLLGGGSRRVTQRHQTLRMTIGWSYELCSPAERLLWTRLPVFAGEFGLDAVEQVCSGGDLATSDIIDTLIGLVDKSIVLRADTGDGADGARYRILDVIREYGAELLEDDGSYQARHLEYFLELATAFGSAFLGPDQAGWVDRIAVDEANIRAALEYCSSGGGPLAGLELATACWGFWMATGRLSEGAYWLKRLLELSPEPTPQRARALWLASWFMSARGENEESARLRSAARETAGELADQTVLLESIRPAVSALRALRLVVRGAHDQAIAISDEILRGLPYGEQWLRGSVLWVKSLALWLTGDLDGFAECQREGIELKLGFGDLMSIAHHLEGFAWLAADLPASTGSASAGPASSGPASTGPESMPSAAADAAAACARTARLQGAADRMWRESVSTPRFGLVLLHAERDRAERLARDVLGPERYEAEHAVGAALSMQDAVGYALGDDRALPVGPAAGVPGTGAVGGGTARTGGTGEGQEQQPWDLLTAREREVASLVADGLTNKDIAAQLVVSKRTVDAHVEHILGKLGYSSRVQIAALASSRATAPADDPPGRAPRSVRSPEGTPGGRPAASGDPPPSDPQVPAQRPGERPVALRRTARELVPPGRSPAWTISCLGDLPPGRAERMDRDGKWRGTTVTRSSPWRLTYGRLTYRRT